MPGMSSIKARFLILVLLAISGLAFMGGANHYLNLAKKRQTQILGESYAITKNIFAIMALEERFIAQPDEELLTRYQQDMKTLTGHIKRIEALTRDKAVVSQVARISNLLENEVDFMALAKNLMAMGEARQEFTRTLNEVRSHLQANVEEFNVQEAMLATQGEVLYPSLSRTREQMLTIVRAGQDRLINLQYLFLFADREGYLKEREALTKIMALAVANIRSVFQLDIVDSLQMRKNWLEAFRRLGRVDAIEKSIFEGWGVNEEMMPKLRAIQSEVEKAAGIITDRAKTDIESIQTQSNTANVIAAVVCIAAMALFGGLIYRTVTGPINQTVKMLKDIAEGEGDLTARLDVSGSAEMKELAWWFNQFVEKLQYVIRLVSEEVDRLRKSSEQLTEVSREMAHQAGEMSRESGQAASASEGASGRIDSMAAAAEEVSAQVASVSKSSESVTVSMEEVSSATGAVSENLTTVAASAEQMSASVNSVATAIEEMYSSLNEVAQSAGRGVGLTSNASQRAEETSGIMDLLGASAREIGEVVDLIRGIAAQTNLLALNATIEAAGAGEAGKGFAVVAGEVKELAKQTAGATAQIREKVESIQANTEGAVSAIEVIVDSIRDINSIMHTIATAVEEQTATTNEISKNVSEVATAAESVSKNVQQAAAGAGESARSVQTAVVEEAEVSRSIEDVSRAAVLIARDASQAAAETAQVTQSVGEVNRFVKVTADGAERTNSAARELNEMAEHLKEIVEQFKV